MSKCTPHPIAALTEKIALTGARDKIARKSYIRAKGYPSIPFDTALAKTKASGAWKTFEMTAGHDAMVDQPQELTATVDRRPPPGKLSDELEIVLRRA